MSKSYSLDKSLRVVSPCLESWETMDGNDQVRFCSHCQKDVHNISNMTRKQAIELAFESKGSLCVKYYKKKDETIKFLHEEDESKSSLMKFAAGLLFAAALASSPTMAQAEAADPTSIAYQEMLEEEDPILTENAASIKGTVLDQQGAVIAGADVTLFSKRTAADFHTVSDENGRYSFSSLLEADFLLVVEANGFKKRENEISFTNALNITLNVSLVVGDYEEVMGLIGVSSPGEEMVSYYKERCLLREIREEAIERGEEPVENPEEIKALFDLVRTGEYKEVKAKVKKGTNLNLINEEGETLLSQTVGNEDTLKLLLKRGADPNARSIFSTTCLMYAAVREDINIAKLLVNWGANVNAVDINGRSSLIIASADNNIEMVKFLLSMGAKPGIRDNDNKTALDYAVEYNHEEIKQILEYKAR